MEFGNILKIVLVAALGAAASLFAERVYKKRKTEQKKIETDQSESQGQK